MLINLSLHLSSESNTDDLKNETKTLHELITQRVMNETGVTVLLLIELKNQFSRIGPQNLFVKNFLDILLC